MALKYIEDGEDENVQRQKHNWNLTEQAAAIAAVGERVSGVLPATPALAEIAVQNYPDKSAEAVISATGISSSSGKTNYRFLIATLKKLGVWSALSNGFLFGSAHQSSATTIKSIKGGNNATGTGTATEFGVTLNGSTNGYTYTAASPSATRAKKTLVAVFSDSNVATGHTSHILSGYSGGTSKGPYICSGGSTNSGSDSTTINNLYSFLSNDGSAALTEAISPGATAGRLVYAAATYDGDQLVNVIHGRDAAFSSIVGNVWDNSATYGIGQNPAGSVRLAGSIHAVLEFNDALTVEQVATVEQALRAMFWIHDTSYDNRFLLFSGNSLTEAASGGGTNWPSKLLEKPAWAAAYPVTNWINAALSGSRVTGYGEYDYYIRGRRHRPVMSEPSKAFVWEGINDVTVSIPAARIISAIDRHCKALKADGFSVYILTLTPVASVGDGMSYAYTTTQQQILADVNSWIRGQKYFSVIDLSVIGSTYPTFLDPTKSDYYVAGDGLHHNDSGRALIADYVDQVTSP